MEDIKMNTIYIFYNENDDKVDCQTGEVYSEGDILKFIRSGCGVIFYNSFEDYLEEIIE